jgi:hypothetical protein
MVCHKSQISQISQIGQMSQMSQMSQISQVVNVVIFVFYFKQMMLAYPVQITVNSNLPLQISFK